MKAILFLVLIFFIQTITAQQPTCRDGAIGCTNDTECQTYTSPSSYCMNYSPHVVPYVCHGCDGGTGCCSMAPTCSCISGQNLIVNGGFEIPICPSTSYCDVPTIPGWVILDNNGNPGPSGEIDNIAFLNCPQGNQCTDLSTAAQVDQYIQTFYTVPSQQYTLSYYSAANPFCNPSPYTVILNETVFDSNGVILQSTSIPYTTTPNGPITWISHTAVFTATTTLTSLFYAGFTPYLGCGPTLDNVQVTCG